MLTTGETAALNSCHKTFMGIGQWATHLTANFQTHISDCSSTQCDALMMMTPSNKVIKLKLNHKHKHLTRKRPIAGPGSVAVLLKAVLFTFCRHDPKENNKQEGHMTRRHLLWSAHNCCCSFSFSELYGLKELRLRATS